MPINWILGYKPQQIPYVMTQGKTLAIFALYLKWTSHN